MKKKIFKILIAALIISVLIFGARIIMKKFFYPLTHFETVKEAANDNNIDPYLVLAIIKTESGFNESATSSKEAKGLMQILDSTASDVNDKINLVDDINDNIYDVDVNIKLGCEYFSSLIKKYNGNYYLAICAYNAGMGNVDKWLENGVIDENLSEYKNVSLPYEETSKYLARVISAYKMYRLLY